MIQPRKTGEGIRAEQKAGWHHFHLQCLGSKADRMKGDWEWLCEEKNHQKKEGWKNRRSKAEDIVSGVTRADGTKLFRVWVGCWVQLCLSQPADPCRKYEGIVQPLSVHWHRRKTLCCCQLLCPAGVLLPKSSCWSGSQNKGTERGSFPLTHLDCGNAGTQELRKVTFQVYSTILVKKAFLFCSHEGDK